MSMVRFLVYSNELDVEGLVAGTSTWMRSRVRPDVIRTVIDAYAQVQPNAASSTIHGSRRRRAECGRGCRPAWIRHGGCRSRQDVATVPRSSSAPRTRRTTAALDRDVGRREHAGAGAAARPRHAHRGAARHVRLASCGSTRSPIRTMRVRGFGGSSRCCTTSRCRRRRTAISTTRRRGRASAAIASTRTRRAPISRRSPTTWVNANIREQGSARQALSVPVLHSRG